MAKGKRAKCGFRRIFHDGVPGMTVLGYLQKKAILPFFVNSLMPMKKESRLLPYQFR